MDTAERFLLFADLVLSFLWMFSSAFPSLLVLRSVRGGILQKQVALALFSLLYLFFVFVFNWLGSLTDGAYNPVDIVSAAIDGDPSMFIRTLGSRIIAEVAGFIVGAELTAQLFPQLRESSCMNMDVTRGAVTEGLISFTYVVFLLWSKKKYPNNFFIRVLIMGVCEVSLVLWSGGCMNPAYAFGWAFTRGDHITWEHLIIYWLAPLEAVLIGFWVSSLLVEETRPQVEEERRKKMS